jgi:hypothetical protein
MLRRGRSDDQSATTDKATRPGTDHGKRAAAVFAIVCEA